MSSFQFSHIIIYIILSVITYSIDSNTKFCNDTICDFAICDVPTSCQDTKYICSEQTSKCIINCNSGCTNINITSSAASTSLICEKQKACDQVSIHIQPIDSKLSISCNKPGSCTNINIQCTTANNCQCQDTKNNQECLNNLHGDWTIHQPTTVTPSTESPTFQPTVHPTSILTVNPSIDPTINPIINPTINPTLNPTLKPTDAPTMDPTANPIIASIDLEVADTNTNQQVDVATNETETIESNTRNFNTPNEMTIIFGVSIFCVTATLSIFFLRRYFQKKSGFKRSVSEPMDDETATSQHMTTMNQIYFGHHHHSKSNGNTSLSQQDGCKDKGDESIVTLPTITTIDEEDDDDELIKHHSDDEKCSELYEPAEHTHIDGETKGKLSVEMITGVKRRNYSDFAGSLELPMSPSEVGSISLGVVRPEPVTEGKNVISFSDADLNLLYGPGEGETLGKSE